MKIILDAEWRVKEDGHVIRDAEKIYCIHVKEVGKENSYSFYSELQGGIALYKFKNFVLENIETMICHNLVGADLQVFKKLLGIKYTISPRMTFEGKDINFIDTLSWSRRLYPDRPLPEGCPTHRFNPVTGKKDLIAPHGLDSWGYRVGIPKPKIDDWRNQTLDVYLHRCKEDVRINELVYYELLKEIGQ